MSTTYRTVQGDTFESIARKSYGSEQNADLIRRANPGLLEPLSSGLSVTIPDLPGTPSDIPQQADFESQDEVAILINGVRFRFWESAILNRSIDSIDTLNITAPFDSDNNFFRSSFKPMAFNNVEVTIGGQQFFKGTMIGVLPELHGSKKIVSASSYSTPGVINDCTMPASSYPLEFNRQGLREIAETLCAPFGISVVFESEPGTVFERVALDPGAKILPFLIKLAKQRNLILKNNEQGTLVFSSPTPVGTPVANLVQGQPPLMSVVPAFNPQEFYSDVTGIEPVLVGLSGSQFTVKNPHLSGVTRPFTFIMNDTVGADIKTAVEAKAARMFANMVSYNVTVNTWRTSAGNLWEPNTTIVMNAPDAMIYSNYEFLVRSVRFDRTKSLKTATLNLVLPGVFEGVLPETLPWDE